MTTVINMPLKLAKPHARHATYRGPIALMKINRSESNKYCTTINPKKGEFRDRRLLTSGSETNHLCFGFMYTTARILKSYVSNKNGF